MPSPAAQQAGTAFPVSRRFVITWSVFTGLWAAWVLSTNLSMDRLAPLFVEAPPLPDQTSAGQDGYAEAMTAYAIHRMERSDALAGLWFLVARAFGPPIFIVAMLVIADMGAPRVMDTVNRVRPLKAGSRAFKIALLLWATLSALWIASIALRLGPAQILSSPEMAFAPPLVTLLIGLFVYGVSLPVRERG